MNPNFTEINAAAASADPDSVLHYYRKLIALRHDLPVIAVGDFIMLLEQDSRVYAFTRSLDGVTLLVLGNFSSDEAPMDLPGADERAAADLLLGKYPASDAPATGITLRLWEARVYRRGWLTPEHRPGPVPRARGSDTWSPPAGLVDVQCRVGPRR